MTRRGSLIALVLAGLVGCGDPLPARPDLGIPEDGGAGSSVSVRVQPQAPLSAAPRALRLRVEGSSSSAGLRLFEGELSSYHLGRIRSGDLPQTLLDREVPALSWSDAEGQVLAPTVLLGAGQIYSLSTAENGLLASLQVAPGEAPILFGEWPPPGVSPAERLVYCGVEPLGSLPEHALLQPGDVSVRVGGLGPVPEDRCLSLELQGPLTRAVLPPLMLGGFALEPGLVEPSAASAVTPSPCVDGASVPGVCVEILDDRVLLRPESDLFLAASSGEVQIARRLLPGDVMVLGGLEPEEPALLSWFVVGEGWEQSGTSPFVAGEPRSHVAINEVYANALGPEPAQEWIELVNHGAEAVQLEGWMLRDAGGEVRLPEIEILPRELLLLVSPGYDVSGRYDPAPEPGTRVVELAALGKNGLSNAGEVLELWTPSGALGSSFPARPKPKSGVSVARATAETPDDDLRGFDLHGAPGASPGAPNFFAD